MTRKIPPLEDSYQLQALQGVAAHQTTSYGVDVVLPRSSGKSTGVIAVAAAVLLGETHGGVVAVKGRGGSAVGRNQLCSCGSGKKRKRCGCET